ncbi:MAG: DNA repair protein RecN [Bacteroidetes bacterium]|nr:DNA repair protein RecN [Bacteroidota bacterium]
MLKKLHIKNYAIIDDIELDFSDGFTIITGETGAGKSILIGALGLILGDRADSSSLWRAEKKSFIEGFFSISHLSGAQSFLQEHDLTGDPDELILRREISPQGKSRAFVNDSPVSLQLLKNLAILLVDLHRQFDSLELGNTSFQRNVLDALANNALLLKNYKEQFIAWQSVHNKLQELYLQKTQSAKELDYYQYLLDELLKQSFEENELENLESELQLLNESEGIKNALSNASGLFEMDEHGLLAEFRKLIQTFRPYAALEKNLAEILKRLETVQIELKDISKEIEHINDAIQNDPARIVWINDRLSEGYKLFKKHGVQSTNSLLEIQQNLDEKCRAVFTLDDKIILLEKEEKALSLKAGSLAKEISNSRKQQINIFESKVQELLSLVGMMNAKIKVVQAETPLQESGMDSIEFLFDANKSGKFESIKNVASGGELSRLMLCIKSLVASCMELPTMIFDEIDSGISGEAARQAGKIMKQIAHQKQVIAISHQPQIAGQADHHYLIFKEEKNNRIFTRARILTNEERIDTIAKMLSGEKPSAAARENAREMVKG